MASLSVLPSLFSWKNISRVSFNYDLITATSYLMSFAIESAITSMFY